MTVRKKISIVTPCFNEEYYVKDVYESIKNLFESKISSYDWELVFVENGSDDHSFSIIKGLAHADSRIKIVKLSRNFRYEGGINAGLFYASGDAAVVIDCDLQDPVDKILEFIRHYEDGFEVVYGIKKSRQEGFVLRTCYSLFYWFFNKFSEFKFPKEAGEFCLMDKKVYKLIANMKEQSKFIRALRFWAGFRQKAVYYDRKERDKGKTKHSFRNAAALAIDGFLSFSAFPLRILFTVGLIIMIVTFIGIIYIIAWRFINPAKMPGYAAIIFSILFLGGFQMMGIGILGEYVYRIYNETRERPVFVVDETINIDK